MPDDTILGPGEVLDQRALNEERVLQERATASEAVVLYSAAATSGSDPTTVLINAITDHLVNSLFDASSRDSDELRAALVVQLRKVDLEAAGAGSSGPSTTGGLLRLLRRAVGSDYQGPADDAEVAALAVVGRDLVEQMFGMRLSDLSGLFDVTGWFPEPEPTDVDAEIEEEAQLLLASDSYPEDPDSVDPDPPAPPSPRAGPRFSKILRWINASYADLIRAQRRNLNHFNDIPHTSPEGVLAEQLIRAHYAMTHPRSTPSLMFDYHIFLGRGQQSTYLGQASGPAWAVVKAALAVGQTFFKPDILDAETREVYEIKPIGQLAQGAAQLFLRYLVPLNVAEAALANSDRKAVAAMLRSLNLSGPTITVPWRPWLPGVRWTPARLYIAPDGRRIHAMRPIPGVIVYQFVRDKKTEQKQTDTVKFSDWETLAQYLAMGLLAGVGTKAVHDWIDEGGREPSLEPVRAVATVLGAVAAEAEDMARRFMDGWNELSPGWRILLAVVFAGVVAAAIVYLGPTVLVLALA